MQITIFGASGHLGQQVVAAALARDCNVVAFVHANNPFGEQKGLVIVQGDIMHIEDVKKALTGSTAVISTLGSWHSKHKNVVSAGTKSILKAMHSLGIKRFVSVTGAGAWLPGEDVGMLDKLNHSVLGIMAPKILQDGEQHLAELQKSPLDWICVRSPIMTGQAARPYTLRNKLPQPFATIPRKTVAICMLDMLDTTEYLRQAPVIYRA